MQSAANFNTYFHLHFDVLNIKLDSPIETKIVALVKQVVTTFTDQKLKFRSYPLISGLNITALSYLIKSSYIRHYCKKGHVKCTSNDLITFEHLSQSHYETALFT